MSKIIVVDDGHPLAQSVDDYFRYLERGNQNNGKQSNSVLACVVPDRKCTDMQTQQPGIGRA